MALDQKSQDILFEFFFQKTCLLLYGDQDYNILQSIKDVFRDIDSKNSKPDDNAPEDRKIIHWLILSELRRTNLFEYGTSPRVGWLTDEGDKLKDIFMKFEISDIHYFISNN